MRGGEVVMSEAVLADAEAREVLAGRTLAEESVVLRGLSRPLRFARLGPPAVAMEKHIAQGNDRG